MHPLRWGATVTTRGNERTRQERPAARACRGELAGSGAAAAALTSHAQGVAFRLPSWHDPGLPIYGSLHATSRVENSDWRVVMGGQQLDANMGCGHALCQGGRSSAHKQGNVTETIQHAGTRCAPIPNTRCQVVACGCCCRRSFLSCRSAPSAAHTWRCPARQPACEQAVPQYHTARHELQVGAVETGRRTCLEGVVRMSGTGGCDNKACCPFR